MECCTYSWCRRTFTITYCRHYLITNSVRIKITVLYNSVGDGNFSPPLFRGTDSRRRGRWWWGTKHMPSIGVCLTRKDCTCWLSYSETKHRTGTTGLADAQAVLYAAKRGIRAEITTGRLHAIPTALNYFSPTTTAIVWDTLVSQSHQLHVSYTI